MKLVNILEKNYSGSVIKLDWLVTRDVQSDETQEVIIRSRLQTGCKIPCMISIVTI